MVNQIEFDKKAMKNIYKKVRKMTNARIEPSGDVEKFFEKKNRAHTHVVKYARKHY